jgi:hypothetical protein
MDLLAMFPTFLVVVLLVSAYLGVAGPRPWR